MLYIYPDRKQPSSSSIVTVLYWPVYLSTLVMYLFITGRGEKGT
jgi:hypothetical protein